MQIAQRIGGAGTGKTTELLRIMEAALESLGGDPLKLGFASFTRAARAEAVTRAAKAWGVDESLLAVRGWFRTVHSTAYRCLGVSAGALLTEKQADIEWLSNALGVKLGTQMDDDVGRQSYIGDPTVAAALNCWSLCRSSLTPLDEVVKRARRVDDSVPDYAAIVRIAERFETAKRLDDRIDFTDMLSRFAGVGVSPTDGVFRRTPEGDLPEVSAWLFDEQQDASPLLDAACKRLISAPTVKWCYVVGDPFQCQPAGTPVLTANGYKPIETLDPKTDWLVAFNKKDGVFYGTGGGTKFQTASRVVDSGSLVEITFDDGTKSVCTANHRWLVRTSRKETYATYLMRKGDRWRIGTVQMFANASEKSVNKNGEFRLKMRMNQEAADSVWVLKCFGTDREARMYEQIASCKYGIPQVTFRAPWGKTNLNKEFIDGVFAGLGDLFGNAVRCLQEHDLELDFPFSTKADRSKNGSKASRFLQASNILPGIHVVPKLLGGYFERRPRNSGNRRGARGVSNTVEWVGVHSVRRLDAGTPIRVYSLEVERHHTYVTANGIVTGNCIYGFAGSTAECFLAWDAVKKRTMPKSYRCPAPILELGEKCLRRMHTGYFDRKIAPADHAGSITELGTIEDAIHRVDPREDWLLIARTNYQANRLFSEMALQGKPVKWTSSTDGPTSRSLGLQALYALEKGEPVTGVQWSRALELLPQKNREKETVIARGTKTAWKKPETVASWDLIFPNELEEVGATEMLQAAIASGQWVALVDRGSEWRRQADKWGAELAAEPRVRVGTIHSVKGAEADNVALLTTTSRRVEQSDEDAAQHDEECRIAYVAVTRTRRNLYVINEGRQGAPRMEVL